MKHAIRIPSVPTGRRVRWTFEVSAERREIPVSAPLPAATAPETKAADVAASTADGVAGSPTTQRPQNRLRTLALAAIVAVLGAALVPRYLGARDEADSVDSWFESQGIPAIDGSATAPPIVAAGTAPTHASTPTRASTPTPKPELTRKPELTAKPEPMPKPTPTVARIASPVSAKKTTAEPSNKKNPATLAARPVVPAVSAPTQAVSAPPQTASAPTHVATPAIETHERLDAVARRADAEPAEKTASTSAPRTATTAADEVTITGCLEVSDDEDRFRLAVTDGAGAPKARSWRTGFLKKRPAAVDLVWSSGAPTLSRQVGKRVAATGVLAMRELKVSSVRVVSSSCN